jgi:hypothetical protein
MLGCVDVRYHFLVKLKKKYTKRGQSYSIGNMFTTIPPPLPKKKKTKEIVYISVLWYSNIIFHVKCNKPFAEVLPYTCILASAISLQTMMSSSG